MDTTTPRDTMDLRQQLDDLRTAVDNTGSFIFIKDRQGCYTFVNHQVQRLFGMSMDEILGQDDSIFFSLEASRDLKEVDEQVLGQGRPLECQERNIIAATGEERFFWTVKRPLFDEQGAVRGLAGVCTDITEKIQLEKALREKQTLLETVLDHAPACIYLKDPERRYVYLNQQTAALYGHEAKAMIGSRDEDLLTPESAESCRQLDDRVLASREPHTDEERVSDPNGNTRVYETHKVPIIGEDGAFTGFIGFSQDMTEARQLQKKLDRMAHEDQLTGLPNRRRTEQILEEEINRSHRTGQPLSLLALDLDHFKWVNDRHGHDVGDHVLIQVGVVLGERLRSTDTLGRWGGEEFFAILPDTGPEGAQQVAETLRETMASCVQVDNTPVTVSIGVTEYTEEEGLKAFIQRADNILYRAKHSGRNQVALISSHAAFK